MKTLKLFLCLLFIVFMNQDINAQTIRERIVERLAHRQQANEIEQEDGDGKLFNPENATVQRNISYGADNAQRFDVYIPNNVKNAPVILMVHGGAWRLGDKAINRVVENKANRWLPKGIIFVSINYRMLPKADPLTQANDVALALAKAQTLAPSWGGDPNRFVIMGHSAGAHLVALISANPNVAKQQGAQPWLGSIMLDSAAYDIEQTMASKHYSFYDNAFGTDNAFWKSTSPSHQLTQKTLPMLAVCSSKRKDQPCIQAAAFIEKAVKLGTQANLLPESMSHKEINENLGLNNEYTKQVEAFMRALGLAL